MFSILCCFLLFLAVIWFDTSSSATIGVCTIRGDNGKAWILSAVAFSTFDEVPEDPIGDIVLSGSGTSSDGSYSTKKVISQYGIYSQIGKIIARNKGAHTPECSFCFGYDFGNVEYWQQTKVNVYDGYYTLDTSNEEEVQSLCDTSTYWHELHIQNQGIDQQIDAFVFCLNEGELSNGTIINDTNFCSTGCNDWNDTSGCNECESYSILFYSKYPQCFNTGGLHCSREGLAEDFYGCKECDITNDGEVLTRLSLINMGNALMSNLNDTSFEYILNGSNDTQTIEYLRWFPLSYPDSSNYSNNSNSSNIIFNNTGEYINWCGAVRCDNDYDGDCSETNEELNGNVEAICRSGYDTCNARGNINCQFDPNCKTFRSWGDKRCKTCKDGYWRKNDQYPCRECVPYCLECKDYVGCKQDSCEIGYRNEYDEACGIKRCIKDIRLWDYNDKDQVSVDTCNDGIICDRDDSHFSRLNNDDCEDGYFKKSRYCDCELCETYLPNCEICEDWAGCKQCKDGFKLVYDRECGIHRCTYTFN